VEDALEASPECERENFIPTPVPTQFPTMVSNEATEVDIEETTKPKQRRNTKSFAKKMILATRDLFLNPLYIDKFEDDTAELVGQIKECPREANGKQYRIDWRNPMPEGLEREWLQTFLVGSEEVKKSLLVAMDAYETSDGGGQKKSAIGHKKKTASSVLRRKESTTVNNRASAPVAYVSTARASATSVRTSSTISTLSRSSISSPEAPRRQSHGTRSSQDVESTTDDGDDLDEEDNMYDPCDDDSADDVDLDSVNNAGTASGVRVLSELLNDIEWKFRVGVTIDEKEALSTYNGPTGLKPRVANSFSTPFECLAVCGGLDYDLVSRLARNSNEYVRQHILPKDRNRRLHGQPFVDKSDQMRAAGGGFAAKAHYQKWYKRVFFAILDMMTLNALIAWNLSSVNTRLNRPKLKRHEFLWSIAQDMLEYHDATNVSDLSSRTSLKKRATSELPEDDREHQGRASFYLEG
jgi:hypothetical protein